MDGQEVNRQLDMCGEGQTPLYTAVEGRVAESRGSRVTRYQKALKYS